MIDAVKKLFSDTVGKLEDPPLRYDYPRNTSSWVEERPDEIGLDEEFYWAGDEEKILTELTADGLHHGDEKINPGQTVNVLGARTSNIRGGILIQYISEDGLIREAHPDCFRLKDNENSELRMHAFDRLIDEAWSNYADRAAIEPQTGEIRSGGEGNLYIIDAEFSDQSIHFEVEYIFETEYTHEFDERAEENPLLQLLDKYEHGGYSISPLDDNLSESERMRFVNVLESMEEVAEGYDLKEDDERYLLCPEF